MVTILEQPKKKLVRLFRCPCGCKFTAESGDYTFCYSLNNEFSYYVMECPHCKITHIHPFDEVAIIEVDI